jgi:hypothetical protein
VLDTRAKVLMKGFALDSSDVVGAHRRHRWSFRDPSIGLIERAGQAEQFHRSFLSSRGLLAAFVSLITPPSGPCFIQHLEGC